MSADLPGATPENPPSTMATGARPPMPPPPDVPPPPVVPPMPETPSAIREVLRAGALYDEEPLPLPTTIPIAEPAPEYIPVYEPAPGDFQPALNLSPARLTPADLLTPEVIAPELTAPPVPTPLERMTTPQALLSYFGAHGLWALSFGIFLIFTRAYVDYPWWVLLGLGWLTCFLAMGAGYYLQAIIGFGDPRASAKPLWIAAVISLLGLVATIGPMRNQGLYNEPWLVLLSSLMLMSVTGAIGFAIARGIQQSGHLIAVAVVGLVVDMWSVFQGPTKAIAEDVITSIQGGVYQGAVAPPLANFFLLRFPTPGITEISAMLGAGDLVFLSFFFGCVARFGLPLVRNYLTLVLGIFVALAIAQLIAEASRGQIPAIPALPVIAPLFILVNLRHLRMAPREWRVTGYFVAGLLLMMVLVAAIKTVG